MKKTILFTFLNLFLFLNLYATHNRAGEITYSQIGDKQIECTISMHNKTSSVIATSQRDSLEINWGDGNTQWLYRVNGIDTDGDGIPEGEIIDEEYGLSVYKGEHTYSEQSNYLLTMSDPNRNAGILNVNYPNSDNVLFYLETEVFLSEDENNSPTLMLPPIDIAYIGEPFIHVPNAVDSDGDKIVYKMVTPKIAIGEDVPNYMEVTDIMAGPMNMLSFDETTGMLIWDAPQQVGEYNIAIEIFTYRNGELNGRIIRDMQILVMPEQNLLPEIEITNLGTNPFLTYEIGDEIVFEIEAMDSDENQTLELSLHSELMDGYITLPEVTISNNNTNQVSARFSLMHDIEHLRQEPYQLVIKARDNNGLATFEVIRFYLIAILPANRGVDDIQQVKIFPNPSNDFISIKNLNQKKHHYIIYDVNGRSIQRGIINNSQMINIQGINAGTYFIKIEESMIGQFIIK